MEGLVKKNRIAIIGAGFTGLTAAYELTKKGFSVEIFEKGNDIGGLAGGFMMHGASIEKAYHHLFRTDTDILSLIDELGLHDELKWFESKVAMMVTSKELNESNKEGDKVAQYSFNGVKDLLLYKPLPLLDRIRAGVVLFFLQKYRGWKKLISHRAYAWMEKWSGHNVMDAIWGPLLQGKFSRFATEVSMAWLWARIHIRANSRKSIFEKELLAYPHGGFHLIADRLLAKTAETAHKKQEEIIHLNASISEISYEKDYVTLNVDGKKHSFDALLTTIPEKAFTSLIKGFVHPVPLRPSIDYLSAVVLVFSSEQSLSRHYWHNIIAKDSPFLVFLQHTNLAPTSWYENKNLYYIGVYVPQDHRYMAKDTSEQEIIDEWYSYLNKLFPEFDPSQVLQKHLFRFPHAQHVVDTTYLNKIPPYELPYPHTYLSNFAQIFPEDRGTNYAVREGRRIAEIIEHDLIQ